MVGKPFQPGRSGNPGGRPKAIKEVQALARSHAPDALNTLIKIAKSGKSDAARVAAANVILDRAYGKPAQAITSEGGGPLIVQLVQFGDDPPAA